MHNEIVNEDENPNQSSNLSVNNGSLDPKNVASNPNKATNPYNVSMYHQPVFTYSDLKKAYLKEKYPLRTEF